MHAVEIFGITYADSNYGTETIFAPECHEPKANIPFAWMFYVIRTSNHVILFDTGFRHEHVIDKWQMRDIDGPFVRRDVLPLLKRIGIDATDVTDVILTHSDFDHAGNVDLFENAHVYVQERELAILRTDAGNMEDNPGIAAFLDERERIGKLTTYADSCDVGPLSIRTIGGHTPGSSVAEMRIDDTDYIFLGDECYLLENAEHGKPIGWRVGNPEKNTQFTHEMQRRIATIDPDHAQDNKAAKTGPDGHTTVFLPFHDPCIAAQFPAVGPDANVVRIL